ncbi:hypothetical protein [Pelagicoccus sp. SDUM812005]|uniref:hypothetical protein n=1 Tax=Pelagicoccus sp. SDUM812005 TaxID=3041257 RepID=UPI0028105392|nr:hypothetical protein [Pelagicoccus sp. SDUM812005]MDQ8183576.1 hypothetical protein [Pelagicoccus sp. SDUM812005]
MNWLLRILCLAALLSAGVRSNSQELERVRMESEREGALHPGDVFQLRLGLEMQAFQRWELEPPQHPHLRLLSSQAFPVQRGAEGGYLVYWDLSYQAIEPGRAALEGGSFFTGPEGARREVAIEAREVQVLGFEELADADRLEPLPQTEDTKDAKSGWLIAGLLAGFVVLVGLIVGWKVYSRRLGKRETLSVDAESELALCLKQVLAEGSLSKRKAGVLYSEYGDQFSEESRAALERYAYSKSEDTSELLAAMRKEVER